MFDRWFKKIVFSFATFLSISAAFCQIPQIDSVQFEEHIAYLERKLNFTYYSEDQQLWWINKFNYSEEREQIQIRHISTKSLGKVVGKKYNINSVKLSDLNPFNLTISKSKEAQGRFVKGYELSLHTVKGRRLIRKEQNSQRLTPRSFIYISLPEFLNDNEVGASDSVFIAFQNVINHASTIYNQKDDEANFKIIFETLLGNHHYDDENGEVKRYGEKFNDYMISFEDYQERQKLKNVLFGYDPINNRYYELTIMSDGSQSILYFTIEEGKELALISEDKAVRIWFANKSKIHHQNADFEFELTHLLE
ncbi:MAG: hypothetical protein JXR03_14710 [Cyclobacteriaceae bacterium]